MLRPSEFQRTNCEREACTLAGVRGGMERARAAVASEDVKYRPSGSVLPLAKYTHPLWRSLVLRSCATGEANVIGSGLPFAGLNRAKPNCTLFWTACKTVPSASGIGVSLPIVL